jgi:hypothetical protein
MASVRVDGRQGRPRSALRVSAALLVGAVCAPALLWHDVVIDIASAFRLDWRYLLMGWTPWVLMALGLVCFIPVGASHLRDPDRRFARRGTNAWAGWGVTLYLLGFALATQVAQIAYLWTDG